MPRYDNTNVHGAKIRVPKGKRLVEAWVVVGFEIDPDYLALEAKNADMTQLRPMLVPCPYRAVGQTFPTEERANAYAAQNIHEAWQPRVLKIFVMQDLPEVVVKVATLGSVMKEIMTKYVYDNELETLRVVGNIVSILQSGAGVAVYTTAFADSDSAINAVAFLSYGLSTSYFGPEGPAPKFGTFDLVAQYQLVPEDVLELPNDAKEDSDAEDN